jgi:hypothetical protein
MSPAKKKRAMPRVLDSTEVLKQLDAVGDKLAARGLTREDRLGLLRRQAQLGDLRDAIAERSRRAAYPPTNGGNAR